MIKESPSSSQVPHRVSRLRLQNTQRHEPRDGRGEIVFKHRRIYVQGECVFSLSNIDLLLATLRVRSKASVAVLGLLLVACPVLAQSASSSSARKAYAKTSEVEAPANPIADPKAVVVIGHARFTVLTPEMVRMEWAADGKFEDHASFAFINRRLAVPGFEKHIEQSSAGQTLTLKTRALELKYVAATGTDGRFNAENLSIAFTLNGEHRTWHPGMPDTGNLLGTTRTLDGAQGDKTKEPIDPGLISRDGWSVVDDSTRPLFDSANFEFSQGEQSPWPWVMLRPAGERQDWYFFGYGHDYKKALGDYRARRGYESHCRRGSCLARGGRATGPTATRNSMSWSAAFGERCAARCPGHRYGLAHQWRATSGQAGSVRPETRLDWLYVEQDCSFPTPGVS